MSTITLYRLVNNLEQLVSGTTSGNNTLEYIKHASSRDDAGMYRCQANNNYGNGHKDIIFSVKCTYFYNYFDFPALIFHYKNSEAFN